jgi:hypothetical protein
MVNYQQFLHIALEHDYYANGQCADFVIVPDDVTQKIIKAHRLLVRAFSHGITVLAPVNDPVKNKKVMIPVDPGTILTFRMLLHNDRFYSYTAGVDAYAQKGLPVFEPGKNGELALRHWEKSILDVFGIIRLAAGDKPGTFRYGFSAKKYRWNYILVTDDEPFDAFSVQHDRTLAGEKKIDFLAPVGLRDDKVRQLCPQVLADFPKAGKLLIQSKEDIPAFQNARRNIRLRKGDLVLVEHLANPQPDDNGLKVIKYLKNQKN